MGKSKNKNRGNSMTLPDDSKTMDFSGEYPNTDAIAADEETDTDMNPEQHKEPDMPSQPEPKKVVPASKTLTLPTTPMKQNTNVEKIKNLTAKFEEAYSKREETIGILISICNYLNTTNDPKVFREFSIWFSKNSQLGCMDDENALKGIHTIQNKKTKTRVEATHQCFMELARVLRSNPKSHYRFSMRAMRALEISERLALWLIQRASN